MNKLLAVWGVDLSCKCALIGFGHTRAVQSMRPENQNKVTLEPYNLQTILKHKVFNFFCLLPFAVGENFGF